VEPRLSVNTCAPMPIGPLTVWIPAGTLTDTVFTPDLSSFKMGQYVDQIHYSLDYNCSSGFDQSCHENQIIIISITIRLRDGITTGYILGIGTVVIDQFFGLIE
jgi:hypothetical protein